MRIAVCIVGVRIQEIQIDGLKSQLNDKQINYNRKIFLMTIIPHLRSVSLLLREGVT